MTEHNPTETNQIEAGSHINRNNVLEFDCQDGGDRYKTLNTSPRHAQAGQEGYLLKDRQTGAIHIANLDTNFSQPNYRVNATNIRLTNNGHDVTSEIIDDLSRSAEYDRFICKDTVRIEYAGDSGWPDGYGDDNWDVVANVITE